MARRKESGIELIASLPWKVGVVLGVSGFIAIRYGIGWAFSASHNPFLSALGRQSASGGTAPIAWMILGACWIGALVSVIRQRNRQQLLETQTGLDSLRSMSWCEFEMLVGEAFRRQGYTARENGLGGADGGIDLILHKDDKTTLVQCKQWKNRRVGVKVVREMAGLLAHHKADAVKIVCVGQYSADARHFAQDKPIELIHGDALLAMVRSVQSTRPIIAEPIEPNSQATPGTPECPRCGSSMIERENRQNKQKFWGCSSYPVCRGTRHAADGVN